MILDEGDLLKAKALDGDPLIGRLLAGKFLVLERIGSGGMGSIYKAINKDSEQLVALKLISETLVGESRTLARFKQEAVILGSLQHHNIVHIKTFGIDDNRCFLVLEYLEGRTLEQFILENGPLDPEQFVLLFEQAVAALSFAHAHGIVHRDVKPENFMLVKNAEGKLLLKILDFGVSRLLDEEVKIRMQVKTHTAALIGTPHFMSPEQCATSSVDQRSDIYSLGCVMYYALAGTAPFIGESAMAVASQHISDPLPQLQSSESARFNALIAKATAKRPEERYQSMDELKHALIHGEIAMKPHPVCVTTKKAGGLSHKMPYLLTAIILGSAIAFAVNSFANKQSTTTPELPQESFPTAVVIRKFAYKATELQQPASAEDILLMKNRIAGIKRSQPTTAALTWANLEDNIKLACYAYEALAFDCHLKGDLAGRDAYFRQALDFSHKEIVPSEKVAKDWASLLSHEGQSKQAIEVLTKEIDFWSKNNYPKSAKYCRHAVEVIAHNRQLDECNLKEWATEERKEHNTWVKKFGLHEVNP
jgi:eukaryotic-like serine/threonine-protein kinase